MRVLMISTDRGLFGGGTSGDVVERHKKYADLAGHLDIIVFAGGTYSCTYTGTYKNLRVFPTKSSKFSHYRKAVELAEKLISENSYDLLITQDLAAPAGEKIKQKTNIPWIVSVHSMFFSTQWLGINPINWYLLYRIKKAIKKADGFRVNNQAIADKLKDWDIDKPILIQPTAIDIKKFQITNYKFQTNSKSQITILYVGRLSHEKNLPLLIRAFNGLRSTVSPASPKRVEAGGLRLVIVGDGPERGKLERLADQRQSAYPKGNHPRVSAPIEFTRSKSIDELPEIYQSADIFVLPSNTESFGQVLLQAAASGCAIIATKTAGAQSIVEHEKTGLLVEVGDQIGLEKAMRRLIEDEDLRKTLSENARKMADKHDQEKSVRKLIDFWKSFVLS